MDHHKNKEKTQKEISIAYQDDSFAAIRTVNETKYYDKNEEMESNSKHVDEPKTQGNHQEHDRIGKSSETKQVHQEMERTEDTEFANKGIANSYQEKSKAHHEISLESKQDTNPNGSKAVIQRRTEITERKEETELNRKLVDELKTEDGNQQDHDQIGNPSEMKQVQNIPNVEENQETNSEKMEITEDTECADKGILRSCQEQSKAHEDTKGDHEKETSEANMNPNESKPDETYIIETKKEIEVVAKIEDSNTNKCNARSSGDVIREADHGVTTGEHRTLSSHVPKNMTKQNEKKKEGSWFSKYCIIL